MHLTITYPTIPQRNTVRTSQVMDYFGIAHNVSEQALVRDLDLPIQAGDVVLFTGASGSGKSSLLRAVAKNQQERLETRDESLEIVAPALDATEPQPSTLNPQLLEGLLNLASLQLPNLSLVDAIPLPFEDTLQLLALCGLAEAPLLLRTPRELSEGQRYRFSLALAVSLKPQWIIADEFTAVLDRTTAKVIAHNVRRIADRYGIGFLLATALDDVAEDLRPNLLVRCDLDGRFAVDRREESHERREPVESLSAAAPQPPTLISQPLSKKKEPRSRSTANSGSVSPPSPIGRISLGGIIAATRSA